ncbi:radical SAM/SPASM domain-containing protein [Nocardiopsis sp. CT-R113]|uniref:Radical SAM/SPASM domain-containing protein n=1 Tax=Nocardiopsis codii TaxID=3065942 RepID=A0ABU7K6W0_9ACTN|nr:radical SAM/SPASM domain-containing protein [Nocardiopsis sp. CT-R113]MEE2037960.1 radical SAM/SPASM domain-containing protein [Nocardiopsis sp. CT-R113]
MTITPERPITAPGMIWLDLTRACQLECAHCYNASGPDGDHGTMTRADWLRTVDQAADTGVRHLQLIGGEPTLHPDAPAIAEHALGHGLNVETYSNMVYLSPAWWVLLQRPGMSLATSYYSHDPARHNAMTGRPASHRHTRRNLVKALSLGIPTRASIITTTGDGVEETRAELHQLGVQRISVDHVRPYGRGNPDTEPDCSGLCGACRDNRASVAPDGTVSPCVFTTWMGTGNVHTEELVDILTGPGMAQARAGILAGKKNEDEDEDGGHVTVECAPDNECRPGPLSWCPPRK